MSEMSEKSRADAKEKVKRLTDSKGGAVDASGWTEDEYGAGMMDTQKKLGNRPISKQNLATGGRAALKHGGRRGRDMGGPASSAGAQYVANVPAPPQNRFSFTGNQSPFLAAAGMKKGGTAKAAGGGVKPQAAVKPQTHEQMNAAATRKTFPNATKVTSEGHPDWKAMGSDNPMYRHRKDGGKAKRSSGGPTREDSRPGLPSPKYESRPAIPSADYDSRPGLPSTKLSRPAIGSDDQMNKGGRAKRAEGGKTETPPPVRSPQDDADRAWARGREKPGPVDTKGDWNKGGRAKRKEGGKVEGQDPEIQGMRPKGGRYAHASGGSAGKGKMNVNIIIAQKPDSQMGPMGAPNGAMLKPPPPPAPPPGGMPPPPPGAGPNMPPPSMQGPPPPPMGRASGGKVYPDMKYAASGGCGRLEKIKKYGGK